jgi:hypothetical protein
MPPAIWVVGIIVLAMLGLLAITAVWVIFRAVTAHGLLWGMKRFLVLGAAVALLFAGVWGWVRFQARLPRGVTAESVEASHATLLARLRAVAREHNLGAVRSLEEKLSGPETRDLLAPPEILQASFVTAGKFIVLAYERPGFGGLRRGYWAGESSGLDRAFVTRGWLGQKDAFFDTLEYLEPATDASGAEVTIQLTLRLDSFLDARRAERK